jgi:hypothetical protein
MSEILASTHTHTHTHEILLFEWCGVRRNLACETSEVTNSPCFMGPKVHYRVHKSPPYVPNLIQVNAVHDIPKISLRSIPTLPSHLRLGLPRGLFLSGFPTNSLYAPVFSHIVAALWFLNFSNKKFHLNYEMSSFKMTPWRLVSKYQHFGGAWCLHLQGIISPKLWESRIPPAWEKTCVFFRLQRPDGLMLYRQTLV